MLTISHAIIGSSIALRVQNPIISFPLAIVLHFLCDLIPHWDVGTNRRERSHTQTFIFAAIDVLLAFIIPILLFNGKVNFYYLISMIFVSNLPDWIESPYLFFKIDMFPFSTLYKIQSKLQSKMQLPYGLLTQIGIVSLFYIIFVNK